MDLHREILNLIDRALAEDIQSGDITTTTLIPEEATMQTRLTLKQAGVIAGLPYLEPLFHQLDRNIQVSLLVPEGTHHKAGTVIAIISGPARGIMTGERVALNFLQHTSGIATITAAYVKKLTGCACAIMDTRKTLPGLRALEKYAVGIGGGVNHRYSLDDKLVIKSNHLKFSGNESHYSLAEAIDKLQTHCANTPIEIEIDDYDALDQVIDTNASAIMLSNMPPEEVLRCVRKIRHTNKKVYVESAGTITLDTVRAYAETGVDGISIGDLTHSVKALDISLKIDEPAVQYINN